MKELKAHIDELGPEGALEALRDIQEKPGPAGTVQYKGTGVFGGEAGVSTAEAAFLESYLNRSGITLQTGDFANPTIPVIASAPAVQGEVKPGSIVPVESNIEDKLQESKLLPGLESSEDIHKVVGKEVTAFTPDVIAKLDAKYGKNKWIVKPYGDEAFASFGVMFPQRIKEIQRSSKETLRDVNDSIKRHGYTLARENGNVVGLKKIGGGPTLKFGSEEYSAIPNKYVKKQGSIAAASAPTEHAARLPVSPEVHLLQQFGIALRKGADGKVASVVTEDGKELPINSPEVKELDDDIGHHIERSIWAADSGQADDARFLVQPAFPAVGVTEADRAEGATWEASTEGRVHVTTHGGKASVIPYATLANRGDALPATFYNQEIYNMEKAVEDAINALPPSERAGQVYAPDVMKTGDKKVNGGWKVVELNASTGGGQSLWLEENPFVIDAYVSHMTGREPSHVKFIRNLLKDKMGTSRQRVRRPVPPQPQPQPQVGAVPGGKPGAAMSFNDDHPRRPAGQEGGGQFVKKGAAGGVRTVKAGSIRASYSTHTNKKISGDSIRLKNYVQQDEHSCAFVAALTVARYFKPHLSAKDVLKTVRPLVSAGVDRSGLVRGLKKLGIKATYKNDLTVGKLRDYVKRGVPVIVSVWPDEWDTDHWTIVQGFDDKRVYLTNHRSLPKWMFRKQWIENWEDGSTTGAGLVCTPIDQPTGAKLSVDSSGHQHRGKGPGGGQFTSSGKGDGRGGGDDDVEFDEFPEELEDLMKPPESKPAEPDSGGQPKAEPRKTVKARARDLLKRMAKAAGATVGAVKSGLTKLFDSAHKSLEEDKPENVIRPESFKHGIREAVRRIKGMGFDKAIFKSDLRNSPELRHYAVTEYNAFNNQMALIEGHLKSAAQMADSEDIKRAVVDKLKELQGLREDVITFRAKKAPEQNATVKVKKGRKNAARENMRHAVSVLSKNPDVHSAVAEVMRHGNVSAATARRYVRAAIIYVKENMEVE